jgi:nicotinamide mononucleotide (NMN) deamidase PncC
MIAATGGGSGALSALLQTPGASRSIIGAVVPYSLPALIDWIGGKPDQACSEATARAMAMASFMRARALAPEADIHALVGVGCTASLATDRPKRGERRIHVAVQSAERTEVRSLSLVDEPARRDQDEEVAAAMLLETIAKACGLDTPLRSEITAALRDSETRREEQARVELSDLVFGTRRVLAITPSPAGQDVDESATPTAQLVFPGSFNPPHAGHFKMAAIAEAQMRRPLLWEMSVTNVDKPPLDFITIRDRVTALKGKDDARPIALTRAATFREKAELFPGVTFVVGVDTMLRIAELRYYDDDAGRRAEAVAAIASRGCRFLVFGRDVDGQFLTLGDLNLPPELRRLCDEVPASAFREDISSTELRKDVP